MSFERFWKMSARATDSKFQDEISQQPRLLGRIVAEKSEAVGRIAAALRALQPRFILIAARGTSDNAARYAKYLFGGFTRIPVALAAPSLYTLYGQPPDMRGGLVIGISQSGQSPDVIAVLEAARRQRVPALAITNAKDSPLASLADHAILLDAGKEESVAASKTYTAQLAVIALLAAHWAADPAMIADLAGLRDLAAAVLEQDAEVRSIAQRYVKHDRLVVLGRGYNYCTAQEIALKIKELSYMNTQAYSSADFRHGPIALLEAGYPTVLVAPRGKTLQDMRALAGEVSQAGADLAVITNEAGQLPLAASLIRLPAALPEWLSPVVAVIPGQLLALHLAEGKGVDVDHPRRLHKVTHTF